MSLLVLFILCFGFSFIGTMPVGMVNMAVADISIRKGKKAALMFASGAAFIEFGQGMITVTFSNLFNENPKILYYIQWAAVLIFLAFGIFYLLMKKEEVSIVEKQYKYNRGWIWKGMAISALNVMPYPFWIFFSALLISNGFMERSIHDYITLSLGMMVGAFFTFILYAKFSLWLVKKNSKAIDYMHRVFGGIFIALAVLQLIRILTTYYSE